MLTELGIGKHPIVRKAYLTYLKYRTQTPLYIDGVYYYLDEKDDTQLYLLRKKYFDNKLSTILENIPLYGMFIDVGAHIGHYTMMIASKRKDANVIAFEPSLYNFALLEKNVKINNLTNVFVHNKAVGARSEPLKLYENDKTTKVSLYKDGVDDHHIVHVVDIDSLNLKPDVIKIDCQGYEPLVIEGMIKTIKANPNLKIMLEYYPYGLNKIGWSSESFIIALKILGFNALDFKDAVNYDNNHLNFLVDKYKGKEYTDLWLYR